MEKTTFTKAEIREFFYKISREIHGEALLLPTMNSLTNPEVLEDILSSQQSLIDFTADLSKKQGMIEGKVDIMIRFIDFFDLKGAE